MVTLALFSQTVSLKEKAKIIVGINNPKCKETMLLIHAANFQDFLTKEALELLSLLNISDFFIQLSPEEWRDNVHYKNNRNYVKEIRMLNNTD